MIMVMRESEMINSKRIVGTARKHGRKMSKVTIPGLPHTATGKGKIRVILDSSTSSVIARD